MSRYFEVVKGYDPNSVRLPTRASASSAGYDLRSLTEGDIAPGETKIFPTGLKAKMNSNEVLIVTIRSSLGIKRHLGLANGIGIIDADYFGNESNDGEILVAIHNHGQSLAHIQKGERIAQGIFLNYLTTDEDKTDGTRSGGIGSSGTY